MMKTSLGGRLAACSMFLLLASQPAAAAITHYVINFSSPNATGGFDYDDAIPEFSNFQVKWLSSNFLLTDDANNPLVADTPNNPLPCISGATGALATFTALTSCPNLYWRGESDPTGPTMLDIRTAFTGAGFLLLTTTGGPGETRFRIQSGTLTVTATPEPATFGLVLWGVSWAGWRRLRRRPPLQCLAGAAECAASRSRLASRPPGH